ncbi:MAG: DNA-formamidopyrimidine glycosylase family protein, partial [Myxococcota bacterium]
MIARGTVRDASIPASSSFEHLRWSCVYSVAFRRERMPELPEVEIARRDLESWLLNRSIRLEVRDPELIQVGDQAIASGGTLVKAERRGKFILLHLVDPAALVVLHLRMTGQLLLATEADTDTDKARTRLLLVGAPLPSSQTGDEVRVRLVDTRRLGRAWLLPATTDLGEVGVLAKLGPEPWPIPLSAALLRQRLGSTRRAIKVALLDQAVIAGVGNIIASESLWSARIHPGRSSRELNDDELRRLGEAIAEVCGRVLEAEEAIDGPIAYVSQTGPGGTTDYFRVYGRDG